MPDQYGFDHLPRLGIVFHRCVECGWPDYGVTVPEEGRSRHHATHTKAQKKAAEKAKAEALVRAREAAAAKRREDNLAYGRRDA